jgi:hypothetical protein
MMSTRNVQWYELALNQVGLFPVSWTRSKILNNDKWANNTTGTTREGRSIYGKYRMA